MALWRGVLNSATSPVRAGDTLWVRGGVYTAPIPGFTFNVHGTPNRPVRFRNYDNERAMPRQRARGGNSVSFAHFRWFRPLRWRGRNGYHRGRIP